RITACDSKESSKSICKEIALQRPKTGKFDYLSGPVIQLIQWLLNSSRTTPQSSSASRLTAGNSLPMTSTRASRDSPGTNGREAPGDLLLRGQVVSVRPRPYRRTARP